MIFSFAKCSEIYMMRERQTEWISFRDSADWFCRVEDWMRHQAHIPTRAAAVRELIERGLQNSRERSAA
jgi:hypothetical protein